MLMVDQVEAWAPLGRAQLSGLGEGLFGFYWPLSNWRLVKYTGAQLLAHGLN